MKRGFLPTIWCRLIAVLLVIMLGWLAALPAFASKHKEVFVLHSYSQEYAWTKRQHEGFVSELAKDPKNRYGVRAEYLDTKRVRYDAAYARLIEDHLSAKYRGYMPAVIYVTDDDALVFALENLSRVFPTAPVIFSGVNNLRVKSTIDPARVTGVFERKEIGPNLALIKLIAPDATDIVVVGDASVTDRAIAQEVNVELARRPGTRARMVSERSLAGVLAGLHAGSERFVVLTTMGGLVDRAGSPAMLEDSIDAIASLGRHTIISMEDGYLVKGVLGGYVTSGLAQGQAAARLVMRHAAGEPISAIAPVDQSPNEYLVDAAALKAAGLTLPPDLAARTTLLNPLPSTYQRYQRELILTLLVLGALVALSVTTSLVVVMRKNRQIGVNAHALRQQAIQMAEVQETLVRAQRIAAVGNWDWHIVGDRHFWSAETCRIFGIENGPGVVDFESFLERVHPEDRAMLHEALRMTLETSATYDITHRIVLPDGAIRVVRENAEVLRDQAGVAVRMIGTVMDVTAREFTAQALRSSEERLRKVIESLPVVLWIVDREGRFLMSEGKGLESLGMRPGQLVGQSIFDSFGGLTEAVEGTRQALAGHSFASTWQFGALAFEVRYSPLLDEAGEIKGAIGVAIDVTERKQSEDRLAFLANYDPVTGLCNRFLFNDRLGRALQTADRQQTHVALLFVDLDNFKHVNDSLGHAAGDDLLKQVAARLGAVVRSADTVSRLGGDEFTLVLEGLTNGEEAVRVAEQILQQSARPYVIGAREVHVTASVGIALYPQDAENVEALVMHADAAMYRAKENGRNGFEFFTAEINARAHRRLQLASELRGALVRNEFSLHYQPKVALEGDAVVGFEALLRWRNAQLGSVSPAVFIPVLEEIGLIVEVGEWVLREACRWAAALPATTGTAPAIAVNLSARQFSHPHLDVVVQRALLDSGLPASHLELEITESSLMDADGNLQTMDRLKKLGVALSIDDFGTGYSSLSYLKRFPVDRLKVDASFVRDVAVDADDAAIVVAIIGLAHHLGLRVVAEGVETPEQLSFLRDHGCDEVQGYLISRPMPAKDAVEWARASCGLCDAGAEAAGGEAL
ncbi:MAG: EAL domain-containing protein [Methylibium sp.]|nr:EAL domain-containing protein [Methylibium sp.]